MAMRLGKLDLNLLIALDILLEEKSVSIAAERLCLSQSAISASLARLREYFGDELLVLRGRKMFLTERADELRGPVRAVLEQIRNNIASMSTFDPSSCDRTIRIMASDYSIQVLIAGTIARMSVDAPRMSFELLAINDNPGETLERGQIDLLVTIDYALSQDHPSILLHTDNYVLVGCASNSVMTHSVTREIYFSLGHVTARFGRNRVPAFDEWFLKRQQECRRFEVIAPNFRSVPDLIVGTNRVATILRRLADRAAREYPLVLRTLPFDIPPIHEAVQWNKASTNDKAIRWVVDQFAQAASNLDQQRADKPLSEAADITERSRINVEFRSQNTRPSRGP